MPLFETTLATAVPIEIARIKQAGGPTEHDFEEMRALSWELSCRGDVLLYGGKRGESAALMGKLIRVIALLAFLPGGLSMVKPFGLTIDESAWRAQEPARAADARLDGLRQRREGERA